MKTTVEHSRKEATTWLVVYALCGICFIGGLLVSTELLQDGVGRTTEPPREFERVSSPMHFDISVKAVLDLPTETPMPTTTVTATPTVAPRTTPARALNFCGTQPLEEGNICRMPMPTLTPSPTFPTCYSEKALDGGLCVVRFTPTPEPAPAPTSRVIPTLPSEE